MQEYNMFYGIVDKSSKVYIYLFNAIVEIIKDINNSRGMDTYNDILPSLELKLEDGSKLEIAKVDDVNFCVYIRHIIGENLTKWEKVPYVYNENKERIIKFEGKEYNIKDFLDLRQEMPYEVEQLKIAKRFKEFCEEYKGNMVCSVLTQDSCKLLKEYQDEIRYDLKNLNEDEFTRKYGKELPLSIDKGNNEKELLDYDFPILKLTDGPICKITMTDRDYNAFKYLLGYIGNQNKEFGSKVIEDKNIGERFKDSNEQHFQLIANSEYLKDKVCNVLQVFGIDYKLVYNQDSFTIVCPVFGERNGQKVNLEDIALNLIDNLPDLTTEEKRSIVLGEKKINDRDASVKQYRKAIEIKR